jgi:long-chain-acyl-CoA dehydrogenase
MVTRNLYEEDHEDFRRTVAAFFDKEVVPHQERWEEQGIIDRSMWKAAAEAGVIGFSLPEQYGGGGISDYRFEMIRGEESAKRGLASSTGGWGVSDGIVPGYLTGFGSEHLQQRYLPGLAAGELIGAIAMTEPGVGSDLQNVATRAVRDGDDWLISGAKTFITNGQNCDFVIVVARTDPDAPGAHGTSLFIVDDGTPGFTKGRKLAKASGGLAGARAAFEWTAQYVFSRKAYGATIGDLQNTQFELADMEAKIDMLEAFVDRCALALNDGTLTAVDASKAKMLGAELQVEVVTRCLQLHGGYGYMLEYPIGRAFRDSRIQTIYGGTTEVMKHIVGKDIRRRYRQDR